jgi:ABC-2 type transport system permease protein
VILNFAVFGILGYLFYAFIFGAIGALASKTEDINTSSMPVTLVFIAVFMISVIGMQNTKRTFVPIPCKCGDSEFF